MKLVIYKTIFGLKVTPQNNFKAYIQNAREVTNCSSFDTAEEIISYYEKYCHASRDEFIIDESAK